MTIYLGKNFKDPYSPEALLLKAGFIGFEAADLLLLIFGFNIYSNTINLIMWSTVISVLIIFVLRQTIEFRGMFFITVGTIFVPMALMGRGEVALAMCIMGLCGTFLTSILMMIFIVILKVVNAIFY